MRLTLSRSTLGHTRWGVFTNLTSWTDLRTLRVWYVTLHTPWRIVDATGLIPARLCRLFPSE